MHILLPSEAATAVPLPRDARLSEALMWKRRRWQAAAIMEGYDRHDIGPEYLDAEEDYHRAKEKHRSLIQGAWIDYLIRRSEAKGKTLDATLNALRGDTNWTFGVKDEGTHKIIDLAAVRAGLEG